MSRNCAFSPVQPIPGGAVNATIEMSNDGWCAVRVKEADGQPFLLGLVRQRPERGTMLVQKLGGETRLEYTPSPGFAGSDRFTAALRPRAGAPGATVPGAGTGVAGRGVP